MNITPYILWEILALVAIALMLITAIILMASKFTKNRYYQKFHNDELIKKTKTANTRNKLYFTSGETYRYIKKYVVCESQFDKFIVVNYNDLFKKISFFVMCYKNKRRPFRIMEITEIATLVNGSKLIVIPKKTKYVNIIVKSVNGTVVNQHAVMPMSLKRINAYAVTASMHLFSALFTVRHLIGYYICTPSVFESYLNELTNYFAVAVIFVVSILTFFIAKGSNKKKNKKNLKEEGVLEYDFA